MNIGDLILDMPGCACKIKSSISDMRLVINTAGVVQTLWAITSPKSTRNIPLFHMYKHIPTSHI